MMTTTTTTTTTTTVVTAVTAQGAVALSVMAVATLIGLLMLKEVLKTYAADPDRSGTWKGSIASFYAVHLGVAIVPLAFIFGLVLVTKLAAAF